MIKAFIFDFDGLIIDTEYPNYQTWVDIYHKFKADLPLNEWIKCVGSSNEAFDPIRYLRTKTNTILDETKIQKDQFETFLAITDTLPVLPGVETYFAYAKQNNLKLAVASSSSLQWVSRHLETRGLLPIFDLIITADDVERVKPAPDLFLKVKEQLGLQDYEGVIFEDSAHGIEAAVLANLYAIAVPNRITKHLNFDKANLVVKGLDTLEPPELLRQLNAH
jgi:HAD superfamily hydrolase (TIGR01509 family)